MFPDRYQIKNALPGGMGQVYVCSDTLLERDVAIKILSEGSAQRRMLDEINALLKIRSKHVVQVYDVLRFRENQLALVLEYVDGIDLFDKKARPRSLAAYLNMLWQIASGISDIHSVGIIHRDIKPNNMKIDGEKVIKIFDFGLARDDESASTIGFIGTKGFSAPERYVREEASFTSAVDVYAFGACALYLACGGLPQALNQQPPKPPLQNYFEQTGFNLSPDLTHMLHSCLNHSPDTRPKMSVVRDLISAHLLKDKHKALIVFEGRGDYLGADAKSVQLKYENVGSATITYDGFSFRISQCSGDVFVNDVRANIDFELPGACVVALGAPALQSARKYITFDISYPEIIL